MLLDVTLPLADAAFRAGSVSRWHVREGDPVEFGTVLCDVAINEFAALQRTKRASLLGSTSKLRQRRVRDGVDYREGRGEVVIRLTSVESGMTVREIAIPDGGRVEIGDLLARLGPTSGDRDDTGTAEARLSVDFPDVEEIDPFE